MAHGNHRRGGIYSAYETPEQYCFMTTSTDSEGDGGKPKPQIPKINDTQRGVLFLFIYFFRLVNKNIPKLLPSELGNEELS